MNNPYGAICSNCGLTWGSHHAGKGTWPYNYCPGHQNRMDWENGPGTTFVNSGEYKEVPNGTPARGVKNVQL